MTQSCCVLGGSSPRTVDRKKRYSESRDWSRLEDIFFRINTSLVNIVSNLDSLTRILEDSEDDPLKASKKQVEFSTRFTRNYLCELRQKMNDIRKYLEHSENENPKNQLIFQCFTSSFQTVHQAFQNIEKNLRYVIFNKMPLQISEFLNCFGDLCMIANAAYWDGCGEKLLELQHMNSSLISKLNDIETNTRKAEIQKKEKQRTILQFKSETKKPVPAPKKNKGIHFSMYKSSQASNFEKLWKKKTRLLAEARFGNIQEFQVKNDKNKEESIKTTRSKEKLVAQNDKSKGKESTTHSETKEETSVRPKRKMTKPVPENEMETMVQSVAINSITSDSELDEESNEQIEQGIRVSSAVDTEGIEINDLSRQVFLEAEKFPMGPVLDEAFKTMFNHIMSQVMTNIDPENKEPAQDEAARNSVAQEVKKSNFREDNVKLICIVEDETSNCVEVIN